MEGEAARTFDMFRQDWQTNVSRRPIRLVCSSFKVVRLHRQREFCHFADIPSPSLLKHLLKGRLD